MVATGGLGVRSAALGRRRLRLPLAGTAATQARARATPRLAAPGGGRAGLRAHARCARSAPARSAPHTYARGAREPLPPRRARPARRPCTCTRAPASAHAPWPARARARTHVCPAHKSYTPGAQGHAHRHRRCGSRLLYALLATHGGPRTLHPTPLPWRPTLPERKRGFGPRGVGAVCHPGQGLLLTPRATAPGPAHTAVLSPGNAAQESPRPKGAPGTQAER